MRDVKRVKIRLFKENYNFLLKIYNSAPVFEKRIIQRTKNKKVF